MLCNEEEDNNQESIQSSTTPDLFDISVKKMQLDKNLPIYLSRNTASFSSAIMLVSSLLFFGLQ